MQHAQWRSIIFIFLLCGNSLSLSGGVPHNQQPVEPAFETIMFTATGKIVAGLLGISLYLYTALNFKKTEPKRVYPKDDSWYELCKFIHNELLVGQKYYSREISGYHLDPENPSHLIAEHSKIEARGLAGQTEYYVNKVIWPTVILLASYNALKQAIANNANLFIHYGNKPKDLLDLKPITTK